MHSARCRVFVNDEMRIRWTMVFTVVAVIVTLLWPEALVAVSFVWGAAAGFAVFTGQSIRGRIAAQVSLLTLVLCGVGLLASTDHLASVLRETLAIMLIIAVAAPLGLTRAARTQRLGAADL
jgi:hypothetical protein